MSAILVSQWLSWFIWLNIRSLAVLGLTGLVLLAIRRAPASTRHLVSTASCVALLALPILTVLLPTYTARVAPPNSPILHLTSTAPSHSAAIAGWLLALWIAGIVLKGGRMIVGLVQLRRLTLESSPVRRGWLRDTFAQLAYTAKVFAPVHYRTAADPAFQTPVTWGHRRPIILLPSDEVLAGWPEARLTAVLHHEFAHIRRSDWLIHQIVQIVCVLYWFNPLVLRLAVHAEHLAEQACDDDVLLLGVDAPDYATHLLAVATAVRNSSYASYRLTPIQAMALPKSKVESRMLSILSHAATRARLSSRMVATALLVVTFVTLPLATIQLAARTIPAASMPAILMSTAPVTVDRRPASTPAVHEPIVMLPQTSAPEHVPATPNVDVEPANDVPVDVASQSVSSALAPAVRPNEMQESVADVRPIRPVPAAPAAQPQPTVPEAKPTPPPSKPADTSKDDQPFVDMLPPYQPISYPKPQIPRIIIIQGTPVYQPKNDLRAGGSNPPPVMFHPYGSTGYTGTTSSTTTGGTVGGTVGSTTGFGTTGGSTTTGSSTTGSGTTGSSESGTTAGTTTGTTGISTTGGSSG